MTEVGESKFDRLYDQMLMMVIMATIMPLFTTLTTTLIKSLIESWPTVWVDIKKIFGPRYYSLTVRKVMTYSQKTSLWTSDPDENYNGHLIHALLEFISKQSIYPDDVRSNLGMATNANTTTADYMKSRSIEHIPIRNVRYGDFYISYSHHNISSGEKTAEKRTVTIKILSKKSVESIEKFVRDCYDAYVIHHFTNVDNTQYFYKQMPAKSGIRFKKYPVNNKTIFDSLHFPEKDKIIELVENFTAGSISKLAFMLTGTPGTGKTSVIKALANKLGYHIIEVKLSFMMSDAALNDVFHNKAIMHYRDNDDDGEIVTDYIPLNKRIYILEDVDAECNVIHSRVNSTRNDTDESDQEGTDKSAESKDKIDTFYESMMKKWLKKGLTLAGVLNVLDGVLEINGSVIVMTTNHPEKLDSAFYRPGRVTLMIELKRMLASEGNKIIANKFGTTLDDLRDYVFTPAELFYMCQSCSNIKELRDKIGQHYSK